MIVDGTADILLDGVAVGDAAEMHALCVGDIGACWDHLAILETFEERADDAEAAVRGMFQMLVNHLSSDSAAAALAPVELLLLVRGDLLKVDAWVQTLDTVQPRHLIVVSPGTFVSLADRFLRFMTCADYLPEVGDLSWCQTEWRAKPLANQPRDDKRFFMAMNFAMMSTLMVFYHELAHIIRGHGAYLAHMAQEKSLSVFREFVPLGSDKPTPHKQHDVRRVVEFDADVFAGRFFAMVVREQQLFTDIFETHEKLCWATGLVSGVMFNVFEDAVNSTGYRAGYHLPGTRMECFLEGFAREMGITDHTLFIDGINQAFGFCADHYHAPGDFAEIEQDRHEMEQKTWPLLAELGSKFVAHIPNNWPNSVRG